MGNLAEKYAIPPHEVMEWDWHTREFNSIVAAARDAYEADKQYERRMEQRDSKDTDPEPPEHGFDFADVDNRMVMTESGKQIPASMAQDQNIVVVEDDEDTDENE